ncbi:uncharacterized protein [Euwallacea similis]|uniref:uncharacterized protein n=1 Tax=Euwallacea similis TaxID=1736056 RepID=UPI00344B396A
MKFVLVVLLGALSLAPAAKIKTKEEIVPKTLPPVDLPLQSIPDKVWLDLKRIVLEQGEENASVRAGVIQADVTQYVLEILKNVQRIMVQDGFDPMHLSDQYVNLLVGYVSATNGSIQHLSTITISNNVFATYSSDTKILELTLPLAFDSLLITYDYHTQALLIGVTGDVNAEISNVKLNLQLGMNFTDLHAFVHKADITNSGTIKCRFTGLGLLDWIIDLLSDTFTTLCHGIIISVIDIVIQVPVELVVGKINEIIDEIFAQNSTLIQMN